MIFTSVAKPAQLQGKDIRHQVRIGVQGNLLPGGRHREGGREGPARAVPGRLFPDLGHAIRVD
jgi:hypothetical protein